MSYYLNYIVPFADCSTDRILCYVSLWHRVNARGTAYIQAMFRRNSLKNNWKNCIQLIWNCWIGIFYFVSLWPWPLTCAPQNVYSSSTCHFLLIEEIWDRSDEKRQRNRVTQVGPIFKDCLLVTLTFVLWPCKCKGILFLLMAIIQPSFIKIGWKMTEKLRLPVFLFCVLAQMQIANAKVYCFC